METLALHVKSTQKGDSVLDLLRCVVLLELVKQSRCSPRMQCTAHFGVLEVLLVSSGRVRSHTSPIAHSFWFSSGTPFLATEPAPEITFSAPVPGTTYQTSEEIPVVWSGDNSICLNTIQGPNLIDIHLLQTGPHLGIGTWTCGSESAGKQEGGGWMDLYTPQCNPAGQTALGFLLWPL